MVSHDYAMTIGANETVDGLRANSLLRSHHLGRVTARQWKDFLNSRPFTCFGPLDDTETSIICDPLEPTFHIKSSAINLIIHRLGQTSPRVFCLPSLFVIIPRMEKCQ